MIDRDEEERQKRFTRRALLLFGGQCGIAGLLAWRMHQLQVVEAAQYQLQARDNRVNVQPIAPIRGEIFDRNGAPLAVNRHNYRVQIIRERSDDIEATFERLQQIIDISPRALERAMRRMQRSRRFVAVPLVDNLSWEEFARINANLPTLPGVEPDVNWTRFYPERESLAHVIGYVAAVNERDLERDTTGDPALRLPDARIGKNGTEKAAEMTLRGQTGRREIEVNAAGREQREISRDNGLPGTSLTLTIDQQLQRYVHARLVGESAAAVVMDVRNGDLLALASTPAYDPNKFVFGISHADWNALRENELDPLRDKATAGLYPPGSTFKMLTAIAAQAEGAMKPGEKIRCVGHTDLGNRRFHCWKRGGHGSLDMQGAIKHSCDIYFYEAAKRIGIDKLAQIAQRFGIGTAPELELPNVKRGVMPTQDWKFANIGERWQQGETLIAGIGQGFILTSPLQLAVMTARLADGRAQISPRLVKQMNGADLPLPSVPALDIDERFIDLARRGMNAVVNETRGTAYRARILPPEFAMAGKTGTAQVRRISKAERESGVRKNEELPWKLRDHALFVAYAPVENPRFAVSVVIEHGGSGSGAAAPVARDILLRAQYGEEPPLEAYPRELRDQIAREREARAGPIGIAEEG
ncbi:MAG: penicillin-binding protein 2 [Neomegalonema sp.]|nr:penicillin-binding protein 2 [Neomegalonema sp.]